ncbi:MAG: ATP-dependent helicase [Planctomycetaceae bacterium]
MSRKDDLTPSQREAVEHLDGPLLVLAGPGSGKTRVITRRIARMVEKGVDPCEILGITFTNKAAGEMASRVSNLLPGRRVWISTFHRFCARVLREQAEVVGLRPNFTIFDMADQRQLIREALGELELDAVHFPPARIAERISRAKNDLLSAEQFARFFDERVGDHMQAAVARVYPRYQKQLLKSNAVDFDDLLLHVVTILTENPEIRARYDEQYRYVLVDEYQDTNLAQYRIVVAMSRNNQNLCATGDPDQSIYGWRGARIDNILRFESDFPSAKVVRLEENFRSTKNILRAADALISHNVHRKAKGLITDNSEGAPVELLHCLDNVREAQAIADEIQRLVTVEGRHWSDFAIFYRVNALSREIERALARARVPYQVAAGVAFYERAEIKDMLGYLRLIQNPNDEAAFRRVVNSPARGIGRKTLEHIAAFAARQGMNLLEVAAIAPQVGALSPRAVKALEKFSRLIDEIANSATGSVEELLRNIITRSGYREQLEQSGTEQDLERIENVEELVTAARQFDETFGDDANLEGFLEAASLVSDLDALSSEGGQVTLMTLHSAKGLEFPVVFVLAVEENLIPHERSIRSDDPLELEEERRLLFVGMTRAEERLYLTHTQLRDFRGQRMISIPSSFLRETEFVAREVPFAESAPDDFDELDSESGSEFSDEHGEDVSDSSESKPAIAPAEKPLRLMTGADLLQNGGESGSATGPQLPIGFAIGMTVRHPRYGLGTVVNLGGFAKRRTVTVEFRDDGHSETFVAAKCPLQPVGAR